VNTNSFEARAPHLAESLVEELDPLLQEATADAGWGNPIELTQQKGVISLEYFEFREEELFNLEYGTEDRPPTVVIRPFLTKADVAIRNAIEGDALDYLFEKGILP
jgi:hypothetical protein